MRAELSVDRLGSGIHNLEYNERNAIGVDCARWLGRSPFSPLMLLSKLDFSNGLRSPADPWQFRIFYEVFCASLSVFEVNLTLSVMMASRPASACV